MFLNLLYVFVTAYKLFRCRRKHLVFMKGNNWGMPSKSWNVVHNVVKIRIVPTGRVKPATFQLKPSLLAHLSALITFFFPIYNSVAKQAYSSPDSVAYKYLPYSPQKLFQLLKLTIVLYGLFKNKIFTV